MGAYGDNPGYEEIQEFADTIEDKYLEALEETEIPNEEAYAEVVDDEISGLTMLEVHPGLGSNPNHELMEIVEDVFHQETGAREVNLLMKRQDATNDYKMYEIWLKDGF